MLSKDAAAQQLGVSSRTIERLVKSGALPARYERGARKPVPRFAPEDLEAYQLENQVGNAPKIFISEETIGDKTTIPKRQSVINNK